MAVFKVTNESIGASYSIMVPDGTTHGDVYNSQRSWFVPGDTICIADEEGIERRYHPKTRLDSDTRYAVIDEWCVGTDAREQPTIVVHGVFRNMREAKQCLADNVGEGKACAEAHSWFVFVDRDDEYRAGDIENYSWQHTRISIKAL